MLYSIENINKFVGGRLKLSSEQDVLISNIVFDTRKISFPQQSIFVALQGQTDGHNYISQAYDKGIRVFLISTSIDHSLYPDAAFIICDNTLAGLQKWAAAHRAQLPAKLIAITGSNGKTIIKEWLATALEYKYKVGKSPLSYNSQLGVALSLLQLDTEIDLGIIEAGISQKEEMSRLEQMIQPQVGIISNIGDAHSSGFVSKEEKLKEKLQLFDKAKLLIYNIDQDLVSQEIAARPKLSTCSWGHTAEADIHITKLETQQQETKLHISYNEKQYQLTLPFTSPFLIDNGMHVISYLILDNWTEAEIQSGARAFSTLPNRLEIKQGKNNCLIIDDSYTSDLASMQLALEKLDQLAGDRAKVIILTPFEQQKNAGQHYLYLNQLLAEKKIATRIGIGFSKDHQGVLGLTDAYETTAAFLSNAANYNFSKQAILIKGARSYTLDKISNLLSEQIHQTRLETNLSAIKHNLAFYKNRLRPTTKVMAVVKAEAYGSGSEQMAQFLEQQQLDYLAVALIDEGIRLRKQNSSLPIMVFNIQEDNLRDLWTYQLEPEVYNFNILDKLIANSQSQNQKLKIHIKVDSGMHRLGFLEAELPKLITKLVSCPQLEVASIFSHLASSELADDDTFSTEQLKTFDSLYNQLTKGLNTKPLKHILNTAGIIRFQDYQHDMVRLGLGLYGIDTSKLIQNKLELAHTLKAKVIQIKSLPAGKSTGYNRKGVSTKDTMIAIVSIGYADGLMRAAGNGRHQFSINGQFYPTIGNICMDVMMLDLGLDSEVRVGDDVTIFGPKNPIESLAKSCNTISYEIISRLSPRIKRSYIYD